MPTTVTNNDQLRAALDAGDSPIVVDGRLIGLPMLTLRPGVQLSGGTLEFLARGLVLTCDNSVSRTKIVCPPDEIALSNDLSRPGLGTIILTEVETTGQVLLLADGHVVSGAVDITDLTVRSADVRGRADRPHGYGVDVLQGGFTLWNRQTDPSSELTAELRNITIGSSDAPVRGSGVFVGGYADRAGAPQAAGSRSGCCAPGP